MANEFEKPQTVERVMKVEGSVLSSLALFKGRKEIVIEHNGEFYRLKITRQGKLILNK